MKYMSVGVCAKTIGLKRDAVYKMIERKTIPFEQKIVFERHCYRIPVDGPRGLVVWMEREIARNEDRLNILKQSHRRLKEVINAKHS